MKSVLEIPRPSKSIFSARWIDSFCKYGLLKKLESIEKGYLEIADSEGVHAFGDPRAPAEYRARVTIHRPIGYSRITLGGSIGTGESYIDRDWDCSSLTNLVRIFVMNRNALNSLDGGMGSFFLPLQKSLHRFRKNHESQAKVNIQAHYDLGNDFFSLFLDDSWMYSSGIFRSADTTLEEAQFEKNDRICKKLRLKPTDQLIEIGTGWGGFAIHAAKNYGCQVTTTTISQEQYRFAKQRIENEGLSHLITVLFEDYRTLNGQYDKLVSIEMIEAVGLQYLDTYFKKCASLLKPHGSMLLQSILIRDQYFKQASRTVDFIQTHVFPGSAIPAVSRIMKAVTEKTDLVLAHLEDIGPHYASTLRHWAERLEKNQHQITHMGYPEHLYRLWKFYFSYCEGGFLERSISASQFLFTKPDHREEPILMDHAKKQGASS